MNTREWKPRHVVALAACMAAAVIGAPVAVGAATGQLVNIADGTTSTQIAKVDRFGQLKVDPSATRPINVVTQVGTFYTIPDLYVLTAPSSATIALSHVDLGWNYQDVADDSRQIDLYAIAGNTVAECQSGSGLNLLIGHYTVHKGDTFSTDYSDPVILKPFSGAPNWCLVTGGVQSTNGSNDPYSLNLGLKGHVISGTWPPPNQPAPTAATSTNMSPSLKGLTNSASPAAG
ncbi:MAG: hypothetical protein QOI20_2642 [Acidimicrobiaceae bacterium]|jgi:hypothetical protein|nr:hypothetical protein [Acidimicrobiaceae bacterium]